MPPRDNHDQLQRVETGSQMMHATHAASWRAATGRRSRARFAACDAEAVRPPPGPAPPRHAPPDGHDMHRRRLSSTTCSPQPQRPACHGMIRNAPSASSVSPGAVRPPGRRLGRGHTAPERRGPPDLGGAPLRPPGGAQGPETGGARQTTRLRMTTPSCVSPPSCRARRARTSCVTRLTGEAERLTAGGSAARLSGLPTSCARSSPSGARQSTIDGRRLDGLILVRFADCWAVTSAGSCAELPMGGVSPACRRLIGEFHLVSGPLLRTESLARSPHVDTLPVLA
ncbi:hypothetical protein CDD83_7178 [Cordyceps sp. RAO-2017]|nr:hypothetical protein CDD83_7178 [Cordyceps sp. RAO-2017]